VMPGSQCFTAVCRLRNFSRARGYYLGVCYQCEKVGGVHDILECTSAQSIEWFKCGVVRGKSGATITLACSCDC